MAGEGYPLLLTVTRLEAGPHGLRDTPTSSNLERATVLAGHHDQFEHAVVRVLLEHALPLGPSPIELVEGVLDFVAHRHRQNPGRCCQRTVPCALDAVLRRHHPLATDLDPAGDAVMFGAGQYEQARGKQVVPGSDPHRP